MKTVIRPITTNWTRRIATVVTTTAIAGAPFFSAISAQAAPPDNAPAYGYRNKKNKQDKRDRNNRRDDWDNDDNYSDDNDDNNIRGNRQRRTLEGVVVRDYSGDSFELRTDNGRSVTVRVREDEPNRLSRGDRVRVEGINRNGIFVARDIQIISDNGNFPGNPGGGNNRVSFSGTVTNVSGSRRLSVRGDNGRTYIVNARNSFSRIDDGDRVRIDGVGNGNVISNATVTLQRNTDGNGYGYPGNGTGYPGSGSYTAGRRFEFNGTISRVEAARDLISIRAANGRTYTFYYRESEDFRVGQRIRVVGRTETNRLLAERVTLR